MHEYKIPQNFTLSLIIFAKICISDDYRGFILLFVHPASSNKKKLEPYMVLTEVAPTGIEPVFHA